MHFNNYSFKCMSWVGNLPWLLALQGIDQALEDWRPNFVQQIARDAQQLTDSQIVIFKSARSIDCFFGTAFDTPRIHRISRAWTVLPPMSHWPPHL